ncbi:GNAT family N-acetyltransferase [Flavobacterium sp. RHBU_3]|uniref:GNAT family N-acetyltransferase n=1 Tax=Flavobacterium sp. RHBU_3 TaxID=3391184 RepID=UPI0039856829
MYRIVRYSKEYYHLWNEFVAASKNGTFLFHRDFMEYHADRFTDHSLLIFDGEKLVGLLPANIEEDVLYSHRGLTYGGLVLPLETRQERVLGIFKALLEYCNNIGITKILLKCIPYIYHKKPAQEMEYALFLANANLLRRDTLSVIESPDKAVFTTNKNQSIQKGIKHNLEVQETEDFEGFWNTILIPNLEVRHQAKPVHTALEMKLLKDSFPQNIRQFNVFQQGKLVAGSTVFVTDTVVHVQYISGNDEKNVLGSIDFLFSVLIKDIFRESKYFDFGSSNEDGGRFLNGGLSFWKESFGASSVTHDFYDVATENFVLLP